jgi:tetratricopeptide (TPR) repeat protein
MSEETPERLRKFRAEYRDASRGGRGRRLLKPLLLLVVLILGLWGADVFLRAAIADSTTQPGGMSPDRWRAYAIYLEGKNLPEEALDAYARYLETASLTDTERAKVCYSMGTLAADAGDYRGALASFYQAEMLASDSDLKPEIDKKVVLCLEELGRTAELRRELRQRSNAQSTSPDAAPSDTVLAEYGDCIVTMSDLERELDRLPSAVRAKMETVEARTEFLRNLVARRLLLDKALRLELDKDAEILDELTKHRDALVVQALIDRQMQDQADPSPEDVERFYKAEPERFAVSGSGEVPPFEQVKERAERMLRAEREKERFTRLIDETLHEQNVKLYTDRFHANEEEAAP